MCGMWSVVRGVRGVWDVEWCVVCGVWGCKVVCVLCGMWSVVRGVCGVWDVEWSMVSCCV